MTASCFAAMIEQKAGTTHKVTRGPTIIPATNTIPMLYRDGSKCRSEPGDPEAIHRG